MQLIFKVAFLKGNKWTFVYVRAKVAEWEHSRLPPLRLAFGSRHDLKWESW